MGKIDIYNEIKKENEFDIGLLTKALGNKQDGTPDPAIDKASIVFSNKAIWKSDIRLFLHISYGFYGSSSGYSAVSDNIEDYILKVLNLRSNNIINEAIEMMEHDIEISKHECKTEAEEILKDLV